VEVPEADAAFNIARNEIARPNVERQRADRGAVATKDVRDLPALEQDNKQIVRRMRHQNPRVTHEKENE
jgi:hypothetical protein